MGLGLLRSVRSRRTGILSRQRPLSKSLHSCRFVRRVAGQRFGADGGHLGCHQHRHVPPHLRLEQAGTVLQTDFEIIVEEQGEYAYRGPNGRNRCRGGGAEAPFCGGRRGEDRLSAQYREFYQDVGGSG